MEKASLIRRYAGALLLIALIGLGWVFVFAAKGDVMTGVKAFLLCFVPGSLFLSLWFIVELKRIDNRPK